eukprot:2365951-Amphidinium_carterae.1
MLVKRTSTRGERGNSTPHHLLNTLQGTRNSQVPRAESKFKATPPRPRKPKIIVYEKTLAHLTCSTLSFLSTDKKKNNNMIKHDIHTKR